MLGNGHLLWKRQGGGTFGNGNGDGDDDPDYGYGDDPYGYDGVSWWWTPSGMAVRYAVVALIFAAILLFFIGGYLHARRRLGKGLPPLPYHRWMVRRYMRPLQQQQEGYPYYQQPPNQGYQMEYYPPAPPAYTAADAPPPVYQPPAGGSKVMADQGHVYSQPLPPTPGEQVGEGSYRFDAERR